MASSSTRKTLACWSIKNTLHKTALRSPELLHHQPVEPSPAGASKTPCVEADVTPQKWTHS
jgi:hypothetical protein